MLPEQGEALVIAEGVRVAFDGREVLSAVDLRVHAGEIVTLIGPNGAGKSTLVRAVLGLIRPSAGTIRLQAGLRIGYMPQRLTVDANLPLTVRRFLTLTAPTGRELLQEVLGELGIGYLMEQPMQTLSGGETQRVLLARALIRQPQLLVLDEPVQGVDLAGQGELYRLIGRFRDRLGCGVLMVSHDLHLVMAATDTVLCLNRHLCCSGHPETISRHPAYLELFGATAASQLAFYAHQHDHRHDVHGNVIPPAGGSGHG